MTNFELSKEKKESNLQRYVSKLQEYNIYSEEMITDLGNKLMDAPFNIREENGGAYFGGLLDIVLNQLCAIGTYINERAFGMNDKGNVLYPYLYVNKDKLIRVLLLQHIGKCELFVPETEDWRIKKGMLFNFNDDSNVRLKLGQYSLFICQKYGIKLTNDEYEALSSIDSEESHYDMYNSPLTTVVKLANISTMVNVRQKWFKTFQEIKNKNKEEI